MGFDAKPKFVTFDMNGTLIKFRINDAIREVLGVCKPRLHAFDYMFDKLGVVPDELVHVSASPMYDLRPAAVMGIKNKVYVDRGFEHDEHWLGYERITDIADLPVLFGLPSP